MRGRIKKQAVRTGPCLSMPWRLHRGRAVRCMAPAQERDRIIETTYKNRGRSLDSTDAIAGTGLRPLSPRSLRCLRAMTDADAFSGADARETATRLPLSRGQWNRRHRRNATERRPGRRQRERLPRELRLGKMPRRLSRGGSRVPRMPPRTPLAARKRHAASKSSRHAGPRRLRGLPTL